MKTHKLLFTIFIIVSGGLSVFAQKIPPPQPPAPLIYSAPEKSELKEFTSEDETFQITFRGVPKVMKQEITDGNATTYSVYRKGSNSVITVIDYDFEVENQSQKAESNLKKHEVSFDEASSVFGDLSAKMFFDDEHSADEIREFIIGYSEANRLLIVNFTERENKKIRIISARKPTKIERKDYEENKY